jgi:hypothetical protein
MGRYFFLGSEKMKSIEYYIDDMEEQDIRTAPSIDLPPLKVDKFYLPKDGGRFMLLACDTEGIVGADKMSLLRLHRANKRLALRFQSSS